MPMPNENFFFNKPSFTSYTVNLEKKLLLLHGIAWDHMFNIKASWSGKDIAKQLKDA